jgi:acetate kinase
MKILTINCGSSSVKYSLWEIPNAVPLCQGIVERVAIGDSSISHMTAQRISVKKSIECPDHETAINLIFDFLTDSKLGVLGDLSEIEAVAHRVVHGGEKYTHSVTIDQDVIDAIEKYAVLAPLHNPNNLIGIRLAMAAMPEVPHTASWDTAFSAAYMPEHTSLYAIPYEYYVDFGIRRYGYQGLSHSYVAKRAAALMEKHRSQLDLISLHIGNGATVTAVKGGKPYDQSLGFSTCGEGLVMGTRCGDLDPVVPLFLMQHAGMSRQEVEELLYQRSGVYGLSGGHIDRRDIIAAATDGNERANLALDVECYRLRKYIGAYAAALDGADGIIFTAGVGENSPLHRERACQGLEFLGIHLDKEANWSAVGRGGEVEISTPDSPVRVFVIPTDEELVMVEDAAGIISNTYDPDTFEYSFEQPGYIPSYLRFSNDPSNPS